MDQQNTNGTLSVPWYYHGISLQLTFELRTCPSQTMFLQRRQPLSQEAYSRNFRSLRETASFPDCILPLAVTLSLPD